MISFPNGANIVEHISELPDLFNKNIIYADFETTSGDKSKKSVDPWHNCDIAGLAITTDDELQAWYIPVGHHFGNNLPKKEVYEWWCKVVDSCITWANHNIKYDAHVSANYAGVLPECVLRCTLNGAKIVDSDRMKYDQASLSKDWLGVDISQYERALQPYLQNNKDYGAIPIDILGVYACVDSMTAKRLDKFILDKTHEECRGVAATEVKLTTVLFHAEREGMRVNPKNLKVKEFEIVTRLLQISEELHGLVGRVFRPHVADDCFDVLCNQYGLPVLGWTNMDDHTKTSNPSFDKATLELYNAHPYAPKKIIPLIKEYRTLNTLNNLFITKYQEKHINNFMHPTYNQTVRTGRMSCSNPNATQLNSAAKEFIIPPEGYAFISMDFSQIEYRNIVHYIKDENAIKAYNENPDTDFHALIAKLCDVSRKPAKTLNFMIGFGGGKKLVSGALACNEELVEDIKKEVQVLVDNGKIKEENSLHTFEILASRRAEKIYESYHDNLPNLKRTSRKAGQAIKMKGYVRNWYGRHRRLPVDLAHLAFNNLCQSTAADMFKERIVATYEAAKGTDISPVFFVHDEIVFIAPIEIAYHPQTKIDLLTIMETPSRPLRVPIRCSFGVSGKNWYEASEASICYKYSKKDATNLEFLKVLSK